MLEGLAFCRGANNFVLIRFNFNGIQCSMASLPVDAIMAHPRRVGEMRIAAVILLGDPYPCLLFNPFHLCCFSLLNLSSISTAFHPIICLQSCPIHPRLYLSMKLAIATRLSCHLDASAPCHGHWQQRQRGWGPGAQFPAKQ